MKKYKVLFCDLDGTLIDTISEETFPKGIWDMKLKFDVLDAIKKLAPEYVFIVSNQGGIEKGFVNVQNFESKIKYICNIINDYCQVLNRNIDYFYCSVNDKSNKDRKPNIGMLEYFYKEFIRICDRIYKQDCLMIGDASGLEGQFSDTDKKTAENFGIDYLDVNEFVKLYNN